MAGELVVSKACETAVAFASCCRSFEDPVMDTLWEAQDRLTPLLKCFPQDVWKEEGGRFVSQPMPLLSSARDRLIWKSFKRVPTKREWADFRKHARRMRELTVDTSEDPAVLFALQLRTTDEPFLPKLKTFECEGAAMEFIPFIPLLLSPNTVRIYIEFAEDPSAVMVASMIARLSALCPDLERITLNHLPKDTATTEGISEMLVACNRGTLEWFCVDSPLTEEAREVVYQLPKLSQLWTIVQVHALLPPVMLPNLTLIDFEYDDRLDWLQGFRGMAKLETVLFASQSDQIGDFLGEFESVALTTSLPVTLSTFWFKTSRSWNPSYRSLLPFTQLKEVVIDFSCDDGCSSRVDDNIITDLARVMPKLETLKLGGAPCENPTGVTIKGLIALACRCRHLSELCIHFRAASLVEAAISPETSSPSGGGTTVQRQDCALRVLTVGAIPIPEMTDFILTMTLLQNFPHLLDITSGGKRWANVAGNIRTFNQIVKRVGIFAHDTSEAHYCTFNPS